MEKWMNDIDKTVEATVTNLSRLKGEELTKAGITLVTVLLGSILAELKELNGKGGL